MPIYIGDTRAKKVYLGDTLIYQDTFNGVGNAIWISYDGAQTWTQVTGVSYTAGTGFFVLINNNLNDQIVVTNDGQQPESDHSNWVTFYTCVQLTGTFTTYIGCRYTDGTNTDALVMSV